MAKHFIPHPEGGISTPFGYRVGGTHCGLKSKRRDLAILLSERPASAAAVVTKNLFRAPCLDVMLESLEKQDGHLQLLLVNSGNANSCTGEQGKDDVYHICRFLADKFGIDKELIAMASTGIIGIPLPVAKIEEGIRELGPLLSRDLESEEHFEEAMLTTDLAKKHIAVEVPLTEGGSVCIGAVAKGSGMIHPEFATMIGLLTTDADIEPALLNELLHDTVDKTFSMITVDGDTSTNDVVLTLANGAAGKPKMTKQHPDWPAFVEAFTFAAEEMAKAIVRDGEGATKLMEVHVKNALSTDDARAIAKSIASSSLVKAASFGADPNWGRIMVAIGNAKVPTDTHHIDIRLGEIWVVKESSPVFFDRDRMREYLEAEDISISIDMHMGKSEARCWGCDLSFDYVRINSNYTT